MGYPGGSSVITGSFQVEEGSKRRESEECDVRRTWPADIDFGDGKANNEPTMQAASRCWRSKEISSPLEPPGETAQPTL